MCRSKVTKFANGFEVHSLFETTDAGAPSAAGGKQVYVKYRGTLENGKVTCLIPHKNALVTCADMKFIVSSAICVSSRWWALLLIIITPHNARFCMQVFDETKGNKRFGFKLGVGEVIKGWDKGVVGMRVGDRRKLIVPPGMAYGSTGVAMHTSGWPIYRLVACAVLAFWWLSAL